MTSAYSNAGPFTLQAGNALEAFRFVKISSGKAVYADAGDEPIGITAAKYDADELASIIPLTGVIDKLTASAAISAGGAIYVANDGKVSSAPVGKQIGIALLAATANNDVVSAVVWGPRGGNDVLSKSNGVIEYFNDFFEFDDVAKFDDAVTDGGTIDSTDAHGGVLSIATVNTDNAESYVSSKFEVFKFQTNKKLYFETKIKLTEAATNTANWIVGLSDTVAADSLLDNGGGPMASYDGVVFFKVDGTMKIQFETSNAGTQVTDANVANFVSATDYTLGFLYDYNDGVTAKVTPFVNGVAGTARDLVISGLEEMHILLGAKTGSAHAAALLVDYVMVLAER